MSEVSKSLIVTFDALNLVKGIKSIGGPDKQVYYIESDVFAPDRRITPLILQPYILVEDPHKIIASGDKVGELSSAKWYFDEIKSENRITAKEEDASIDTPFALSVNNSLHIRKNVEKAIQLFFEAEYLDIRKNKNIHISLTYLLTTTQSSEVKPAPKLKLSKPQSWKYCPLDKMTEANIEAEVFADNKGYKSAVEWCKVENNKEIPLTDEPFVLGGQNSNKLVVNPDVMGDTLLRARNLSEKVYNKYYGINPEWDNRMLEVMENRNLYSLNNSEIIPYYMRPDGLKKAPDNSVCIYYKVDKSGKYTATIKEIVPIFRIGYSEEDILTGADSYNLKGVNMADNVISKTIDVTDRAKYIVVQFSSTMIIQILQDFKLEQGEAATPYTPAPEDLNYRNELNSRQYKDSYYLGNREWLFEKENYNTFSFLGRFEKSLDAGWHIFSFEAKGKPSDVGTESQIRIIDNAGETSNYFRFVESNTLDDHYKKFTFLFNVSRANDKCLFTYYNHSFKKIGDMANKFHFDNHVYVKNVNVYKIDKDVLMDKPFTPAPEDLAPDGIIKGSYQSDIKFTKYFPEINAEILFLTGDSIRPEHKTINAQAIFTTNKEPIDKPSEFFDIEWFIDPIEAGGVPKQIGTGEFMEIAVSKLPLKGGRLVPIRLKYNFK